MTVILTVAYQADVGRFQSSRALRGSEARKKIEALGPRNYPRLSAFY